MQAVIFIGVQASGKSSFYLQRFFRTHVRVNLDMLRTRNRERLLIRACLAGKQPFVVENTNPTVADRERYITAAKAAGFEVVGYYFQSSVEDCIIRNAARPEDERVPDQAIWGTHKRLQVPTLAEGFEKLYSVRVQHGGFIVEEIGPLPKYRKGIP